MKEAGSFQTLVLIYQTALRRIPEARAVIKIDVYRQRGRGKETAVGLLD